MHYMELYALHALIELHGPEGRKNEVNGMPYKDDMELKDVADSTPCTNEKDEMPVTPYTNGKTV